MNLLREPIRTFYSSILPQHDGTSHQSGHVYARLTALIRFTVCTIISKCEVTEVFLNVCGTEGGTAVWKCSQRVCPQRKEEVKR